MSICNDVSIINGSNICSCTPISANEFDLVAPLNISDMHMVVFGKIADKDGNPICCGYLKFDSCGGNAEIIRFSRNEYNSINNTTTLYFAVRGLPFAGCDDSIGASSPTRIVYHPIGQKVYIADPSIHYYFCKFCDTVWDCTKTRTCLSGTGPIVYNSSTGNIDVNLSAVDPITYEKANGRFALRYDTADFYVDGCGRFNLKYPKRQTVTSYQANTIRILPGQIIDTAGSIEVPFTITGECSAQVDFILHTDPDETIWSDPFFGPLPNNLQGGSQYHIDIVVDGGVFKTDAQNRYMRNEMRALANLYNIVTGTPTPDNGGNGEWQTQDDQQTITHSMQIGPGNHVLSFKLRNDLVKGIGCPIIFDSWDVEIHILQTPCDAPC